MKMFPFFIPFILRQTNSSLRVAKKKRKKATTNSCYFYPSSSDFSSLPYIASPFADMDLKDPSLYLG